MLYSCHYGCCCVLRYVWATGVLRIFPHPSAVVYSLQTRLLTPKSSSCVHCMCSLFHANFLLLCCCVVYFICPSSKSLLLCVCIVAFFIQAVACYCALPSCSHVTDSSGCPGYSRPDVSSPRQEWQCVPDWKPRSTWRTPGEFTIICFLILLICVYFVPVTFCARVKVLNIAEWSSFCHVVHFPSVA